MFPVACVGRGNGSTRYCHYIVRFCQYGFAAILCLSALTCEGTPYGPTAVPTSVQPVDTTREFSGEVVLPPPVVMNLTLIIRGLSAQASISFPQLVVPLIAQETSTVDGTWELRMNPPRQGRISGTLTGERSGFFQGTLTEFLDGCEATRDFSGQITLAGLNWVAGTVVAPCPGEQLEFGQLKLASSSLGERAPGPAPTFHLLVVGLAGDGSGVVTSTPSGIGCSDGGDADCSQRYREGAGVTLTADASSGSIFTGWSGDCDGTSRTVSVTMDAARSCTATYGQATATLRTLTSVSVSAGATSLEVGETTMVTATAAYSDNTTATVNPSWSSSNTSIASVSSSGTVTAIAGGTVTVTGTLSGKSGTVDITVTEPAATVTSVSVSAGATSLEVGETTMVTATAAYSDNTTATVNPSWSSSNTSIASVSSSGTVMAMAGGTVTVTGTLSGKSGTIDITVTPPPATLTVTLAGTGSGVVISSPSGINCGSDCQDHYANGIVVTLIVDAASGSTFMGWSGDCDGNGRTTSVTMDTARTCKATFDVSQATLDISLTGNGSGTVTSNPGGIVCPDDCNQAYAIGTVVTLTANPTAGSRFNGWGDCGTASGRELVTQVTMDSHHSCSPYFELYSQR